MSHKASLWAFEQYPPSSSHKLVLILLADWANMDGVAWPRLSIIADKAQLSLRHVKDVIRELDAEGYLRRVPSRRKDGRQGATRYVLNVDTRSEDYVL